MVEKLIPTIETERLILRKATDEDLLPILNNVWKDLEVAKWMLWKPTTNFFEAVDRLNRTVKFQENYNGYFVCLKETNEPIGLAGFMARKVENSYEENGICISSKYQGNGYGKEVLKGILDTVFGKLQADSFVYGFFSDNEKSKKLCLSFPFEYVETKKVTRKWDEQQFDVDFYILTKEKYEK